MEQMVRVLKRAEDLALLFCFLALLLVEAGYVAWLERLPAFPAGAAKSFYRAAAVVWAAKG